MRLLSVTFCLIVLGSRGFAQETAKLIHFYSSHTSFPDTGRLNGHLYNKVLYDAPTHYHDSSVLVIIPPQFNPHKKVDLVFWFHGWSNNIDSAAVRYDLINQFIKSKINAVLVLAETAKDAPDSYGGKLERKNVFKELVNDVLVELKKEKVIKKKDEANDILLAGHSGAYRLMANILQNGNMPVKEVILFDALYAETDKFVRWIKEDATHRFINIYTNGGGTDVETKEMIKTLTKEDLHYYLLEETQLTPRILQDNRIVFIHSERKHNDIIQNPDNFKLFIENGIMRK